MGAIMPISRRMRMSNRPGKHGQALVEYVLIVCLLALVCIASMSAMGDAVANGFLANISTKLNQANSSVSAS